ncbi:hypothetical protein STRTUCAR8_07190 [Streptomyces turgidiscabies Car8]|uniref:Uncharacterized protein n=1 Tax=Streptomyces turgidiscabies (strain Car8) TaxID=698760 RepID=L7F3A4_STRT8|nr:hypothetical protein STRTUCAR8_07190 [Streptomyces turgidiscabies Car8]
MSRSGPAPETHLRAERRTASTSRVTDRQAKEHALLALLALPVLPVFPAFPAFRAFPDFSGSSGSSDLSDFLNCLPFQLLSLPRSEGVPGHFWSAPADVIHTSAPGAGTW